MDRDPIVSVDELRLRIREPALTIVDCRFTLGSPGAGRDGYLAGHIPSASFLDVDTDLAGPPGDRGRHPLPPAAAFADACARAGIGADSQVVAYDESGEGGAARLWWLLRHFSHPAAAVLDGGLAAWRAAGGPLEAGAREPRSPRGPFVPVARSDDTVAADDLLDTPARLLDARAPARFRGEVEPIDPVAGHIPGARNLPAGELQPGGRYLPREQLRARLGDTDGAVAYCGSGITAATIVLAAAAAGSSPVRLYPGSWSEWSRRGLPVSTGER